MLTVLAKLAMALETRGRCVGEVVGNEDSVDGGQWCFVTVGTGEKHHRMKKNVG